MPVSFVINKRISPKNHPWKYKDITEVISGEGERNFHHYNIPSNWDYNRAKLSRLEIFSSNSIKYRTFNPGSVTSVSRWELGWDQKWSFFLIYNHLNNMFLNSSMNRLVSSTYEALTQTQHQTDKTSDMTLTRQTGSNLRKWNNWT